MIAIPEMGPEPLTGRKELQPQRDQGMKGKHCMYAWVARIGSGHMFGSYEAGAIH